MDMSIVIPIIVCLAFILELWGLRTGVLQRAVRKNAMASGIVVFLSIAVILTLWDKLLGGAGFRYVLYGVLLLFNVCLFGAFFAKRIRELDRESDRNFS